MVTPQGSAPFYAILDLNMYKTIWLTAQYVPKWFDFEALRPIEMRMLCNLHNYLQQQNGERFLDSLSKAKNSTLKLNGHFFLAQQPSVLKFFQKSQFWVLGKVDLFVASKLFLEFQYVRFELYSFVFGATGRTIVRKGLFFWILCNACSFICIGAGTAYNSKATEIFHE